MKRLIFNLVIPLTIISFASVTKWWYALVVDGPEEILIGFPFPFACSGWHTSLSLQLFVKEFIIDLLTYFLFWFVAIICTDRFLIKLTTNKFLTFISYSLTALIIIGASLIASNPDNIWHVKRNFEIEILETGYKFVWQHTEKPKLEINNFDTTQKKSMNDKTIPFKQFKGYAILLGNNIELLNEKFKKVSQLNENEVVEIEMISDSLFQLTKDYCDAFKYLKIKKGNQKGIIDGRYVYQIIDSEDDTTFKIKNKQFFIKSTSYLGISASNEDGLTFCSKYFEPIVIFNDKLENAKFVKLKINSTSKKAIWNQGFKYFELMANDGACDKINQIKSSEKGIILTIKREFQEGWNEYKVLLTFEGGDYYAEYLTYGEIKY